MSADSEKQVKADCATNPMLSSNPKHELMSLSSSKKSFTGTNKK